MHKNKLRNIEEGLKEYKRGGMLENIDKSKRDLGEKDWESFVLICSFQSNLRREPMINLVKQVSSVSENLATRFYIF